MDADQLLREGAGELGVRLDPAAFPRFAALLDLLQQAGESLNLTAVRDPEAIVRRHFIESLALGAILQRRGLLAPGARVLDLGSGAGFPGLPLKLLQPQIKLCLLEATAKKAVFLRRAIEELGLTETQILAGRAEIIGHDSAWRASFDLVTARAVAELAALVELALPFLCVEGVLAAIKGSRSGEEVEAAGGALELCGGAVIETVPLAGAGELRTVLVQKRRPTPVRFPRRPGQPAAHPLRARS